MLIKVNTPWAPTCDLIFQLSMKNYNIRLLRFYAIKHFRQWHRYHFTATNLCSFKQSELDDRRGLQSKAASIF